jgi:outer membrane lipoprotein LolB
MSSNASNLSRSLKAAALAVLLLTGCAELPVPPEMPASSANFASADAVRSFRLAGRIAVKHDGQGFSGTLRWTHDARHDDVFLQSPLGQGVAYIERDASGVTLTTSDDKIYRADTVEALTGEVLGWQLPLHGLEHWVLGRATPDSPARRVVDENGQLSRLIQDGWRVDFERYQTVQGAELPGRLEVTYGSDLEVRLVIDRWVLE